MKDAAVSRGSKTATQKYSRRREAFLTAALKIFTKGGLETTGIKEIAASLGVTHPALYHYFQSKDQIVFESIEKAMLDLIDVLQAALRDTPPRATQQLIALMHAHAVYELRESPVMPFVNAVIHGPLKNAAALRPEQRMRVVGLHEKVLGFYCQVIAKGQEAREFADGPVSVMSSGILSLISYNAFSFCHDEALGRGEFIEAVTEQALRSVGVRRLSGGIVMTDLQSGGLASRKAAAELESF